MTVASATTTLGGRKIDIGTSFEVINPAAERPWVAATELQAIHEPA